MSSNQDFWNRRTLGVAGTLTIAAIIGIASITTTVDEDAGPASQPLTPAAVPPHNIVERLDHSGIKPAGPLEVDTTGMSIAAYGM